MAVDAERKTKKIIRSAYFGIASLLLLLICLLIPQLVVRYHYQQSLSKLIKNDFYQAQIDLQKAREWQGRFSFVNDQKRIDLAEGNLVIARAKSARTVIDYLDEMKRAEKLFRSAISLHSLNIDSYTGLAQATAALETLYPFVYGTPYSSNALPVYEYLLSLMPVNLYTHKLLIKYYHTKKMEDRLRHVVADLIYLSPSFYFQLDRLPFDTSGMNKKIKNALLKAVANKVKSADAYKALSDVAAQEEDYKRAIEYFLQARSSFSHRNISAYYFQLGKLYLNTKQFNGAGESFLASLKTIDRDNRLRNIWLQYERNNFLQEFLNFTKRVTDEKYESPFIEILQAKSLMALGQYEQALSQLLAIKSSKFESEGLNLQAHIAEYNQDWDTMELRSQRATVLVPEKSDNFLLLARALQNQKKWHQAEKVATDAITRSKRKNAWLYHNRAWTRWNRKNFDGAEMDWIQAIEISPETASFYYNIALIYERKGLLSKAVIELKNAINLKPDEIMYHKKLGELAKLQQQ